ncbi:MAG TPA: ATP-grasp domain-containing protein, partial [Anaerolineales bacterium]|nr:ATP-grasp domain-containing protein [Anaerolineales bacterium]
GIGGASLGTEIIKSLLLAGTYTIYGCDISPLAYGHFQSGPERTFVIDRDKYVESVIEICRAHHIKIIIPGGEEPMNLLNRRISDLQADGIQLAGNSAEIVAICSDKQRLFERLRELDVPIPQTIAIKNRQEFSGFPTPCIIKPSTGTGGSRFVFLASDQSEVQLYLHYVLENCNTALLQEYLPLDEGEFTIGVLSLDNGQVFSSIALKRLFHVKLSVMTKTGAGLISSGYSQGLIDDFSSLCEQAEKIAEVLGSCGPINIQARVRNGVLLPFEINPRFSASTYLRALAGFNEIDIFTQYLLSGIIPPKPEIRPGYYLRSLAETVIPKDQIKQ